MDKCEKCNNKISENEYPICNQCLNKELSLIKSELGDIKNNYHNRILSLESKIFTLESKLNTKPLETKKSFIVDEVTTKKQVENPLKPEKTPDKKEVIESSVNLPKPIISTPNDEIGNELLEPKEKEPSAFDIFLTEFFHPVYEMKDYVTGFYQEYKQENKLPVFFLTVAGIVVFLSGAGFLFQYSLSNFFGEYASYIKSGLSLIFSSSLIIGGVKLYHKDQKYRDFASSIMGLAIVLNYLLVYYMSSGGEGSAILSSTVAFIMMVVNTILSFGLAIRYETKIISFISLAGGLGMPLILPSDGSSIFFLAYLILLSIASIITAHKIQWKNLIYITFILGGIVFETANIYGDYTQRVLTLLMIEAYAYLFFYIVFWDKGKFKETLEKNDLTLFASNGVMLAGNIFMLFQTSELAIGSIYLLNAIPFIALLVLKWRNLSKSFKFYLILIASACITLSVPFLIHPNLIGLVWMIEGIVLLISGYLFELSKIRREALIILLIGGATILTKLFSTILFGNFMLQLGHSLTLGFSISAVAFLIYKNRKRSTEFELSLMKILVVYTNICFTLIYLFVIHHFFGKWMYPLAQLPVLILIFLGVRYKINAIEVIGLISNILVVGGLSLSFSQVGSYYMGDQTGYGKLSAAFIMLNLWGMKWYYQKLGKDVDGNAFLDFCRDLFFYIIPLAIGKTMYRHLDFEWMGIIMLTSGAVAYVINKFYTKKLLKMQFYVFFIASVVFSGLNHYSIIANLVILSVIYAIENYENKWQGKVNLNYLNKIVIIGWGVNLMGILIVMINLSPEVSFAIGAAYFSAMILLENKVRGISDSKYLLYACGMISILSSIIVMNKDNFVINIVLSIIVITIYYYIRYIQNRLRYKFDDLVIHFFSFVLYTLIVEQVIGSEFMFTPWLTVLLFVHSIIVLFLVDTEIKVNKAMMIVLFLLSFSKLIAFDLKNARMITKIIAFMASGGLMLLGAMAYLKWNKAKEKNRIEENIEENIVDEVEN
ncbi:DUF2339 domain-containing protein [Aureibacter tunicatorum]|uniref:Membrane protein DUF2339 n=1 Tax=Aureibacter tunicatorum TaxID=866807 RepID=A0AAE3XIS4_9BACT|nr:DUF2339 domain-containing protein [Aureibacter tunicatorum]MDR6237602.1 hypothetical protein [Aureibacter tunicatorum]BDD02636.1 hypothetical protein AUTU_01190 [Aureibacter tunicatorum]